MKKNQYKDLHLNTNEVTFDIISAVNQLNQDGILVIRGANDAELCHQLVRDYMVYCSAKSDYVKLNLDSLGREKRLVNFHMYSDAALQIGTNPLIMKILDKFFGCRASLYTSLTFKYGTQQPVHRDTPHFATWPSNQFVGVWTALEDINPNSGPIFYHPGAHHFKINQYEYLRKATEILSNASRRDQLALALDLYNGEVIRNAPRISEAKELHLNIGDTVIWHAEMPHGGSEAINPQLTRWSVVFHCAPESSQVHQYDAFFSQKDEPPPKYGFIDKYERKIAVSGDISFM